MAVLKTQIVPEPSFAYGALVPLPIFILTAVPSVPERTSFSYNLGTSVHAPIPKSSCRGQLRTIRITGALPPLVSTSTFLCCDVAHTLTRGTLELKPYPVPVAIRTMRCHIPIFRIYCFNLITFSVNVETTACYGLLWRPTFLGFLMTHTGPTPMDYLRSSMQIS